jgi:hypothetical protein
VYSLDKKGVRPKINKFFWIRYFFN